MSIFDFQVQLLPERLAESLPSGARKWGKFWATPISRSLHRAQPWIRFLPPVGRSVVEELGAIAPLSHLLFESSLDDLKDSMEKNRVDRAVLLSDPAKVPNDRLLDISESDPRFVAAVRVPRVFQEIKDARERRSKIVEFVDHSHGRRARILQIHPASDGFDPASEFYAEQLDAVSARGWIVLLQTGAPKVHLVYRKPEFSEIHRFESWFSNWSRTPFVVARMNFSDPEGAMDLAEQYENIRLETSWQPVETIAEATRRIGSERIVFGSDWPILGGNQKIGLHRLRDALESQMISDRDFRRISGGTATELLDAAGTTLRETPAHA